MEECRLFCFGFINEIVLKITPVNGSVRCPIRKNFDRIKGKIWPDNVR
jgi:hypothetical protein